MTSNARMDARASLEDVVRQFDSSSITNFHVPILTRGCPRAYAWPWRWEWNIDVRPHSDGPNQSGAVSRPVLNPVTVKQVRRHERGVGLVEMTKRSRICGTVPQVPHK